ncbi:RNA ligase/cyclic nucleotide phosphodiesterase [Mycena venus]|uniref:RNA ligase/cyclic nucleotide phosphodiesterase n=1 Tax=Mycena venus TaxID=2733690 RepID=A0A8H6X9R1_9AGAR|nr:RNA ligase/cyclic nucleotide phosphodiesterase [Mycena venus]
MPNSSSNSNPFESLIETYENNPEQIQACYEDHRVSRNAQQKTKFLSPGFEGISVDTILLRIVNPDLEPGFVDTRNAMVFIARPPEKLKSLIMECQQMLKDVVPNLWTVPETSLHTTVLEVAHSRTPEEIVSLVPQIRDAAPSILNHAFTHRTRLIKPLLCFDTSAIALSFLPASMASADHSFTYHHLRRDLFALARGSGIAIESRYAAPSAHLTVGRFVHAEDLHTDASLDVCKVRQLVARIEEVNAWLEGEYWPGGRRELEWVVGETGLEWRTGPIWYGTGGDTLMVGESL